MRKGLLWHYGITILIALLLVAFTQLYFLGLGYFLSWASGFNLILIIVLGVTAIVFTAEVMILLSYLLNKYFVKILIKAG
jgi:hypothetical protein